MLALIIDTKHWGPAFFATLIAFGILLWVIFNLWEDRRYFKKSAAEYQQSYDRVVSERKLCEIRLWGGPHHDRIIEVPIDTDELSIKCNFGIKVYADTEAVAWYYRLSDFDSVWPPKFEFASIEHTYVEPVAVDQG